MQRLHRILLAFFCRSLPRKKTKVEKNKNPPQFYKHKRSISGGENSAEEKQQKKICIKNMFHASNMGTLSRGNSAEIISFHQ